MPDPTPTTPAVSPYVAQRLLELCIELGTPRDIAAVLAVILDATTDLLDCGRASMLLYDTGARQLRFVAATSEETAALARIPVPLHGSLAGTIFRENRPLVSGNVQTDTRHFTEPAEQAGYRPRAIAGVPMCVDGQPVGVLEALDPHDGAFTESDVEVLMAVAAQAAVAVNAARQRHALERAHARLEDLDRLKGRVLSLTSDAVRAPLTAVRDAASALRRPGADLAAVAARLEDAAGRMEALMASGAEVGALPEASGETEAVVVQGLLREASHESHPAVRIVLDLPAEPVVASAHVRRLRLALVHVVAAAAQSAAQASDGTGEVTVRLTTGGADAFVSVRDSTLRAGGLPPDGLDLVVARVLLERDGGAVDTLPDGVQLRLPLAIGPSAP